MNFPELYANYRTLVEQKLEEITALREPRSLYEPIRYALVGGGKRIRPILTMISCEAVGGRASDALYAGIAVEILHNFTLVHDDIMDGATLRRNLPTVHTKWSEDVAILTGDVMLSLAHRVLLETGKIPRLYEIVSAFTDGIIEVCEGQAYDLEFESRRDVSLGEYMQMIEKKTAKMLEMAVKTGAHIGEGEEQHVAALQHYALCIGNAFQIQDDLLDASSDSIQFGKRVGGDIVEGKKTYLIARALEMASSQEDKALLEKFLVNHGLTWDEVPLMQDLFRRNGVFDIANADVERLTKESYTALEELPNTRGRDMLRWFADMLLERSH